MIRRIVKTADGSSTIFLEEWDEHYHSKHGAVQEAYHVFIKSGFFESFPGIKNRRLRILEIGFGTGLNAFITLLESDKLKVPIHYEGVEAYPVTEQEWELLEYPEQLQRPAMKPLFEHMHRQEWDQTLELTPYFSLRKRKQFFNEITDEARFDLIYFDAFGARVQPDLWEEDIFAAMYRALDHDGILTTYSSKGSVRRAMMHVGFEVEKLPGPPGKREMLRARKNS
ncbi:tRNA (5-methylaminomethyl-2-thiouridine)(34)-methyltransferase MnmD [Robertkochia aurantiaca]|uniref:tRNA (5-methylaminomethyl-2-thiouridine)(34)-methyltransferase MnmD n=1 Tax=Robertkochia aurantiaca TaxID=2873700 RepID=UPI001CCD1BAB|nr:tRNA (5-methylaminomethyl-2-thiouridine)(34)-methyltransferase MnmD [Robertkochia sp. 3YJGBD-33]